MLRASHRLSVRQFDEIFEKGRVLHSPFFTLRFVLPAAAASTALKIARSPAKIGAVAPNKIAKTASERIRLRRAIYGMVKPIYPRVKKDVRAIIFIKSSEPQQKEFTADLETLFIKAGLLE